VAKAVGAGLGAGIALVAAPAAPGHLGVVVALGLPAAGFIGPDALLDRRSRYRWRRMSAALPDALDLVAVGISTGRSVGAVLRDLATHGRGPLAEELGRVAADIDGGLPQAEALDSLRIRNPGPEWSALAAALERSRRHGAPLADQLRDQATALRREQRRRVEEAAARAAPKIQLVVALVLVPSVLLMIVAGLLANSDSLLAGFR
jgi:tight adherence protein C